MCRAMRGFCHGPDACRGLGSKRFVSIRQCDRRHSRLLEFPPPWRVPKVHGLARLGASTARAQDDPARVGQATRHQRPHRLHRCDRSSPRLQRARPALAQVACQTPRQCRGASCKCLGCGSTLLAVVHPRSIAPKRNRGQWKHAANTADETQPVNIP